MDFLQAIIFSIVEGITEFLPISSTGHLILAANVLRVTQTEFVKSFEIIIQSGAILAVVFLYWKKLLKNWEELKRVLVAFIPTGILGLVFYKVVKTYLLGNSWVVVASLFVGGVVLIILEKTLKKKTAATTDLAKLSFNKSLIIGAVQAIAMIPGVSRSAATIIPAMFLGLDRKNAAEFSFLLAVPTMAAATGLDLAKTSWQLGGQEYLLLGVGFAGSFFAAMVSVKWFIGFVQKHDFVSFGVYRIILALAFFFFVLR